MNQTRNRFYELQKSLTVHKIQVVHHGPYCARWRHWRSVIGDPDRSNTDPMPGVGREVLAALHETGKHQLTVLTRSVCGLVLPSGTLPGTDHGIGQASCRISWRQGRQSKL